jgi:hypothetical protein
MVAKQSRLKPLQRHKGEQAWCALIALAVVSYESMLCPSLPGSTRQRRYEASPSGTYEEVAGSR